MLVIPSWVVPSRSASTIFPTPIRLTVPSSSTLSKQKLFSENVYLPSLCCVIVMVACCSIDSPFTVTVSLSV